MPQKKNPDVAELVRGKTGRVYGDLMALLTVMKGLPMTYNRDLQEDKEPAFDAGDTVLLCLQVVTRMLPAIHVNEDTMLKATREGFLEATDLADYLTAQGTPFRDAHEIIGRLVLHCSKKGLRLSEQSLEDLRSVSKSFEAGAKRGGEAGAAGGRRRGHGAQAGARGDQGGWEAFGLLSVARPNLRKRLRGLFGLVVL